MRLLLDTHVLLWWLKDDDRLGVHVIAEIERSDNDVVVSSASAWEIAIKRALGKVKAPDDLAEQLVANNFTPLPITVEHAVAAGALPLHHRDPFDRMLVAQAQEEQLTVVTADPRFASYGVDVFDA